MGRERERERDSVHVHGGCVFSLHFPEHFPKHTFSSSRLSHYVPVAHIRFISFPIG